METSGAGYEESANEPKTELTASAASANVYLCPSLNTTDTISTNFLTERLLKVLLFDVISRAGILSTSPLALSYGPSPTETLPSECVARYDDRPGRPP